MAIVSKLMAEKAELQLFGALTAFNALLGKGDEFHPDPVLTAALAVEYGRKFAEAIGDLDAVKREANETAKQRRAYQSMGKKALPFPEVEDDDDDTEKPPAEAPDTTGML